MMYMRWLVKINNSLCSSILPTNHLTMHLTTNCITQKTFPLIINISLFGFFFIMVAYESIKAKLNLCTLGLAIFLNIFWVCNMSLLKNLDFKITLTLF